MGCIRQTAFLALPVVSLLFGALPGDVQADICKKKGFGASCVTSVDVQDKSLGLVKKKSVDVKDEAGLNFGSNSAGDAERVVLRPPRNGWALATASVEYSRGASAAPGILRCDITATRRGSGVIAKHAFTDSVNSEKGLKSGSAASTLAFPVKKAKKGKAGVVVRLSCAQLSGSVNIGEVFLAVQYFPTKY